MTQEDKELLLRDLCARLPYGVKIDYPLVIDNPLLEDIVSGIFLDIRSVDIDHVIAYMPDKKYEIDLSKVRPYLRPMSSMTEEEIKELLDIDKKRGIFSSRHLTWHLDGEVIDYLNNKMLDWRELIPKGLALEALEGMYDVK